MSRKNIRILTIFVLGELTIVFLLVPVGNKSRLWLCFFLLLVFIVTNLQYMRMRAYFERHMHFEIMKT